MRREKLMHDKLVHFSQGMREEDTTEIHVNPEDGKLRKGKLNTSVNCVCSSKWVLTTHLSFVWLFENLATRDVLSL